VSSINIPGKRAAKLITRAMLRNMKRGAVLVDVASIKAARRDFAPHHHTDRPISKRRSALLRHQHAAACARTATEA